MHVFAVALYCLLKEENFSLRKEPFRDFLLRMIRIRKLAAGQIKKIYDKFYSGLERDGEKESPGPPAKKSQRFGFVHEGFE